MPPTRGGGIDDHVWPFIGVEVECRVSVAEVEL